MKDTEQARNFIETTLNGLEKSVTEKDNAGINNSRQRFNTLLTEYKKIIGTKSVNAYTQNYAEIMKKGGYLR